MATVKSDCPNSYHVDRELDLVDEVVLPLLDGGHAALDVPQQRRHLALLSAASETVKFDN